MLAACGLIAAQSAQATSLWPLASDNPYRIASLDFLTPPLPPSNFTVEPSQVGLGTTHTVLITSNDCNRRKFGGDATVILDGQIDELRNKGIEVKSPKTLENGCKFTAEVRITDTATTGPVRITIHFSENGTNTEDVVLLRVGAEEPTPPGPLVPGLEPQVDIMWSLVPQKVVKDNFGTRIGKLFYCLEVVIGNDTGYDLQIASVGFNLGPVGPSATAMSKTYDAVAKAMSVKQKETLQTALRDVEDKCKGKGTETEKLKCRNDELAKQLNDLNSSQSAVIDAVKQQADMLTRLSRVAYGQKLTVSSYRMARGSIEHGQFLSLRNIGLNTIKALGPVLTGFLPYFHVLNHRTNFSESINILNNPFEKGFDILIPDETIAQMQRLDDDILRDGMIIPNNRQIRTRVFVPKDILQLEGDIRDDPIMVTQALGEMFLIGDSIKFINRISVTSAPSGEVTPPPTLNPSNKTFDIDASLAEQDLPITGRNLEGAIVTSADPNIKIVSTTSNNTSVLSKLKILDTASPGQYLLTITTKGGSIFVPITLRLPAPKVSPNTLSGADDPNFLSMLPQSVPATQKHTFTGRFLQNASLVGLNGNPIVATVTNAKPDGTSIDVTFAVPAKLAASQPFDFLVTNANNTDIPTIVSPERKITITITPRGVPHVEGNPTIENGGPAPKANPSPSGPTPVALRVQGNNLNDLKADKPIVQEPGDSDPKFTLDANSVQQVSTTGTEVRVNLIVPTGTKVGQYHFRLLNEKGPSEVFTLTVEKQDFVTPSTFEQSLTIPNNDTRSVTFSGGKNLNGSHVVSPPAGWTVKKDESKSSDTQITLDITSPTTFPDGAITFQITNSNDPNDTSHPPATVTLHVTHPPTITGFSVNGGAANETATAKTDDNLDVIGKNLNGANSITIGNKDVTAAATITDTKITFKIPAGLPAGPVEIKVVTPSGGPVSNSKLTITQ